MDFDYLKEFFAFNEQSGLPTCRTCDKTEKYIRQLATNKKPCRDLKDCKYHHVGCSHPTLKDATMEDMENFSPSTSSPGLLRAGSVTSRCGALLADAKSTSSLAKEGQKSWQSTAAVTVTAGSTAQMFCIDISTVKGCKAKTVFHAAGIGKTLIDLRGNEADYELSRGRFEQYAKAVAEKGAGRGVYIVFHVQDGKIRRLLYTGQSHREERWEDHINKGRFEKGGINEITFAWIREGLSRQAVDGLEAACHMLIMTKSKKRIANARFDCPCLSEHSILGASYQECVETQLKAASLYITDVLREGPSEWTPMKLKGKKKDEEEKKRAAKEMQKNYPELLENYAKCYEAASSAGVLPSECPDPSLYKVSSEPSSSEQMSSQYSDVSNTVQEIIDALIDGAKGDEPARKRRRTDELSTSTAEDDSTLNLTEDSAVIVI